MSESFPTPSPSTSKRPLPVDATAGYLAVRRGVGAFVADRDVVSVTGPDAVTFVQGQVAQDVVGLEVGRSAPTLLLQPTGKVLAWLRVTRTGADALVFDVDAGWGEAVATRLGRFKIRVDCEITTGTWTMVALRGPGTPTVAVPEAGPALIVADAGWPGVSGTDLVGPSVVVPDGVEVVSADTYDAVRIESGVPAMGAELGEDVIPAEAGPWLVDASASFTKGCYVGQELVARVESRGNNTPRRLRGIVVTGAVLPPVGASIVHTGDDGTDKVVGTLTSVAESLDLRAPVALALVARSVEPPAVVSLRWGDVVAPARVETLPLIAD